MFYRFLLSAAGDVDARLSVLVYDDNKKKTGEGGGGLEDASIPPPTPAFHTDVDREAGLILTAGEWLVWKLVSGQCQIHAVGAEDPSGRSDGPADSAGSLSRGTHGRFSDPNRRKRSSVISETSRETCGTAADSGGGGADSRRAGGGGAADGRKTQPSS